VNQDNLKIPFMTFVLIFKGDQLLAHMGHNSGE